MTDNVLSKWKQGLARTRKTAFGRIATLLGATEISEETWDELEALLIQADLGVETALELLDALKAIVERDALVRSDELEDALRAELRRRLQSPPSVVWETAPTVVLLVGVNGSGKTTTAAKLAWRYTREGKSVMLAAADTFRAAAIDQLKTWGERLDVPVIAGQPGSDPGAVVYDAIQAAQARGADILFVDTAGRLHTRFNLM